LRAGFALAGLGAAGEGAALAALVGLGEAAATFSDFLAFLACGAASCAPVNLH
jgi:hypothetical protein